MSDLLLTEEEIITEASKDSTFCELSVNIGKWAAKTQHDTILLELKRIDRHGDAYAVRGLMQDLIARMEEK